MTNLRARSWLRCIDSGMVVDELTVFPGVLLVDPFDFEPFLLSLDCFVEAGVSQAIPPWRRRYVKGDDGAISARTEARADDQWN